jgi:hypothetical protein
VELIRRQPRNNQAGQQRRRTRQSFHANARLYRRSHHPISRIGKQRRPRIRNQRAVLALL